jgi:hypothetical protein
MEANMESNTKANMEANTQKNWALFTQYPKTNLISHGEFIFSKDMARSIIEMYKKERKQNTYSMMWIQQEHSDEKLFICHNNQY